MNQESGDLGLMTVMIERLEKERLPRALELKAKVDAGQRLDDFDIAFLERVVADMEEAKAIVARHPEYHELATKVVGLYEEITERALANEQAAQAKSG